MSTVWSQWESKVPVRKETDTTFPVSNGSEPKQKCGSSQTSCSRKTDCGVAGSVSNAALIPFKTSSVFVLSRAALSVVRCTAAQIDEQNHWRIQMFNGLGQK